MNLLHVVTQRILNVFVKETILLTLNRSRTIIKCVVLGVLFTCVLIGLSSAPIFAASEDSPSSEVSSWLAPDLDSVKAKLLAEEVYPKLSDGTRAAYDVNDVYLLLNNYFKGSLYNSSESTTSVFPLVRISGYLSEIYDAIFGNASGNNYFDGIHELLTFYAGGQYYSIAQLQGMTWGRVGDISSTLNLTNSYLSSISSQLSGYNWLSTTSSFLGTSTGWNTTYISSTTSSSSLKVGLSLTGISINTPCVLRIYLPIYPSSSYVNSSGLDLGSVKRFYNNSFADLPIDWDYYIEPTNNGSYIYIFGYRYSWQNVFFEFVPSGTGNVTYNPSVTPSVSYIPFNTDEYQQLKIAFSMDQFSDSVSALSNYLVSPQKQAAEDASQAVIDDTLDGFTGNGSAAAKTSDTGSMKNMSGSIQSGLNSGASASNAASVFSNQTFWSWFTQATSNGINNPYPAPVVQNTRGSGDDVPDFLSGNQAELNDLLNQRDSW